MPMQQSSTSCQPYRHLPRILLALVFVFGGFGFLTNFAATVAYVQSGLDPLGLGSLAATATAAAIVLKLGGGIMLLLNYQTRLAASMLIVFTVAATLLYHTDWSGPQGAMQQTQFLKNLAIIGGLLLYSGCFCRRCKAKTAPAPETA